MTIGIYRLIFTGLDQYYIGQSINIESRYKQHLLALQSNKHYNYKVQEAYEKYGIPSLEVLVECGISELDTTEDEAINIFDSVKNGLNINSSALQTPTALYGESHPRSIVPDDLAIEVVKLLTVQTNTAKYISDTLGVPVDKIHDIASGKTHNWIHSIIPLEYTKMRSLLGRRKNPKTAEKRGIEYPRLISPEGIIFSNITNLKQFCEEHGLDRSNLRKVFNGISKHSKGWVLHSG